MQRNPVDDEQVARRPDGAPEPIALVGLSCRFPGAPDARAFWRLLRDGVDAIGEIPAERFDLESIYDPRPGRVGKTYSRWCGAVDGADLFDAEFFAIPPREAKHMDPQHRLLLEASWDALEDAGLVPGELAGRAVGVFLGMIANDYEDLHFEDPAKVDIYGLTGSFRAAAAGRISSTFGFRGPSLVLDTSCSSSLYAVHLACQSLWTGESTLALAGGVCLILQPHHLLGLSHARMLAADGRCRFGDARADGFVLGEGVGVIVLKPLAQALADGDRIYALIRGSAVNNDGHSGGTMMKTGRRGQEQVMRAAWRRAGIAPATADFVEANGMGAPAGDAAEIEAMARVFGEGRPPERPLRVGSVKTNVGHTEGAAGIAGVIKTALGLAHGEIPPSLHFREPHPDVASDDLPVVVQSELAAWPASSGPRRAGVSATSMSGSNAHVVLEQAPPQAASRQPREETRGARLLALSARQSAALKDLAKAWSRMLRAADRPSWHELCRAAARRRTHHEQRLAVVAAEAAEAAEALEAFLAGVPRPGLFAGAASLDPSGCELEALAAAYVGGEAVAWEQLYAGRVDHVRLPSYPWQRRSFWLDPARPDRGSTVDSDHPLLGGHLGSAASATHFWETGIDLRRLPYLRDHVVEGSVAFPWAAMLEMTRAAAIEVSGGSRVGFASTRFDRAPVLAETPRRLQLVLDAESPEAASFELFSRGPEVGETAEPWRRCAHGKLRLADGESRADRAWSGSPAAIRERCAIEVSRRELYSALARQGLPYGPRFRGLSRLWCGESEAVAQIELADALGREVVSYGVHPAWLDACLQTALAAYLLGGRQKEQGRVGEGLLVPAALESLSLPGRDHPPATRGWCLVSLRRVDNDGFEADLSARDPEGTLWLEARGLRYRSVISAVQDSPAEPWAVVPEPRPRELLASAPPSRRRALAESYLIDLLARLVGAATELDVETPINRQGVESLQAVELRNHLELDFGVKVPVLSLLGGSSIAWLARLIEDSVDHHSTPTEDASPIESGEEEGEVFPLSSMQERFWRRRRADAAAVPSTVPMLFELTGPLRVSRLERSLEQLVARHQVLRTTFAEDAGGAVQRLAPPVRYTVPLVDLDRLSPGSGHASMMRFAESRCRALIDLENGPIFHAMLFRRSPEEHFFFFLIHHIAMDGWSSSLFVHELEELYGASARDQPPRLPALPIQYRHFARWQRRYAQNEQHASYWRRQLRGASTSLPFAGAESQKAPSFRAARESLGLPVDLSRRLRELGRRRGRTLFTILLATFKTLLHFATRREDITVGSFFLNRDRAEVKDLIGNFATILPLRSRLAPADTFAELLDRLQCTVFEAQSHSHVLAERFLGQEGHTGLPLVRVMFMLQNYRHEPGKEREPGAAPPALGWTPIPVQTDRIKHDLVVTFNGDEEQVSSLWKFSADLFDAPAREGMLVRYRRLLERVADDPELPLAQLCGASDHEEKPVTVASRADH